MTKATLHVTASQSRPPKVLIVDDEKEIRDVISELISGSYQGIQASNANEALEIALIEKPSLILLDIMMPGKDGIEACEELRNHADTGHIPVIMLSAASKLDVRVKAFSRGADDFLAKPFDADELLARIEAKIRRFREKRSTSGWGTGNLQLSKSEPFAEVGGQKIKLTSVEYGVLKALLKSADELVTRIQLVKAGWPGEKADNRLIDAHLTSLRKKLQGFSGSIQAIYGKGYILTKPQNLAA
jgi:DNA-binding response OmpR family regulator